MSTGNEAPDQRPKLQRRVIAAAENALTHQNYVVPVELLSALGWLPAVRVDFWRSGRAQYLDGLAVDMGKVASALDYLRQWAEERGLHPSESPYIAATRDRRPLRFTEAGDEAVERAFRTHWLSPDLTDKKREQLEARQSKAPDLVVISPLNDWVCGGCGTPAEAGEFLLMENDAPLCLACADFDHLVFLPAGNAALSRRAKSESGLSALVMEFNRRRKRYQRLGILVEEGARERAEQKCLGDEDVRARRRERDAERRADGDVEFQAKLADEIRRSFPGCPNERAQAIAAHAGVRGSGRVGRSAAGRALDEGAVRAAVVASIRHLDTAYDEMLMAGVPRAEARMRIREDIDRVLQRWS
jgi:hypothetical protein